MKRINREVNRDNQDNYENDYDSVSREESELPSRKVKIDLEIEPRKLADIPPNPYQKLIHIAEAVDSWRIFPRIFISVYMYLLVHVVIWYTKLDAPTMEQSGLISVVVGAGAAWFGLYTGSGKGSKVSVEQTETRR